MTDSVKTPFPECIRLLCENIKLDPYFAEFYKWSREVKVPVIVLSSGMTPIIRGLLVHLIGPEANDIEIVSNEVVDRPPKKKNEEGGWEIQFHDDSHFGHGMYFKASKALTKGSSPALVKASVLTHVAGSY